MRDVVWTAWWWQVVPGTDYVAWRVFSMAGEWVCTDVQHVGDDPLFAFLPEDDADARAINRPHRRAYRQMAALTTSCGPHVSEPLEAAGRAGVRRDMMASMRANPEARRYVSPCGTMGYVKLKSERSRT